MEVNDSDAAEELLLNEDGERKHSDCESSLQNKSTITDTVATYTHTVLLYLCQSVRNKLMTVKRQTIPAEPQVFYHITA